MMRSSFDRLLLLMGGLLKAGRRSARFVARLCSRSLARFGRSRKLTGYSAAGSWIVATIIILALIFAKRISLGLFPVGYTIAIASIGCMIIFWLIIFVLTGLGLGLRAFVLALYRKPAADGVDDESMYRKELLAKLDAARDTSAVFASITTAIIGIIVAVAAWQGGTRPAHIEGIIFVTTFLLILATVTLIHGIDMCDTALNPGLSIPRLERIRAHAMNYYALGLFCLITAMLLGIAVINPYLTAMGSISYMLVASHYFFTWDLE